MSPVEVLLKITCRTPLVLCNHVNPATGGSGGTAVGGGTLVLVGVGVTVAVAVSVFVAVGVGVDVTVAVGVTVVVAVDVMVVVAVVVAVCVSEANGVGVGDMVPLSVLDGSGVTVGFSSTTGTVAVGLFTSGVPVVAMSVCIWMAVAVYAANSSGERFAVARLSSAICVPMAGSNRLNVTGSQGL